MCGFLSFSGRFSCGNVRKLRKTTGAGLTDSGGALFGFSLSGVSCPFYIVGLVAASLRCVSVVK